MSLQQVFPEPWRSFDPIEDDWFCDKCKTFNYGPPKCVVCLQMRILDPEEQQMLCASQHTGENLFGRVVLAEALDDKIGVEMDKTDETIRQWFRGKTQRLKVNGFTKYLLLAVDEDGEYATNFIFTALLPSNCKSPTKVYSFNGKRTLNEITDAVLNQEFGVTLQSQDENDL